MSLEEAGNYPIKSSLSQSALFILFSAAGAVAGFSIVLLRALFGYNGYGK